MSDLLKHKILNFETTPPALNWDVIEERLDDDNQYAYLSGKISAWSVPPPADAWKNIVNVLDTEEEQRVIAAPAPLIQMNRRFAKWAVAAILIIIAGGWFYFSQFPSASTEMSSNTPADSNQQTVTTPPLAQQPVEETPVVSAPAPLAASLPIPVFARKQAEAAQPDPRTLKFSPVENNRTISNDYNITISSPAIRDESAPVVRDMAPMTTDSKYMMVAGPDGNRTRISSRFGEYIRYMNDDGTAVQPAGDNAVWKKRFSQWRAAIQESSYIPTPGNFLDILELKDLIERNQ